MNKKKTTGIVHIESSVFVDKRGAFLNAFRRHDPRFSGCWAERAICQVNISRTEAVGAIRGLHYQADPHGEAKLIRCLRGRVWDVAVDLRRSSPSYGKWQAVELSADKANAVMIPEGFAHGFQVLEPGSELLYLHSGPWVPEAETGVRWNDPDLAVAWPLPISEMSDRDLSLPLLAQIQPFQ